MSIIAVLDERGKFLQGCERDVYSQFGEDGLIDAVLQHVGIKNRWCFEIGAADGRFYSNTLVLREAGWNAVLIESDAQKFGQLHNEFGGQSICIQSHCKRGDLDRILNEAGVPEDCDFGVIDIDGQDFHLWESFRSHKPRIMLVEHEYKSPTSPIPPEGGDGQAGLMAIEQLAKDKGYVPLIATETNLLCCLEGEIA